MQRSLASACTHTHTHRHRQTDTPVEEASFYAALFSVRMLRDHYAQNAERERALLRRHVLLSCQYLYFGTSKASNLRTWFVGTCSVVRKERKYRCPASRMRSTVHEESTYI
jgi:hypothetical protein